MEKKPCQRLIGTIKIPLKFLIEGVLVVLGLFFIFHGTIAATIDDFENRTNGNISGQGNWTGWYANVVDDFSYTGSKSITNPRGGPRTFYDILYTFDATGTSGAVKWWNYRSHSTDDCVASDFFPRIRRGSGNWLGGFIDSVWNSDCDILAMWKDNATETLSAMIWDQFYSTSIAWRQLTPSSTYEVAFAVNDVWTSWKPSQSNTFPTEIYLSFNNYIAVWFDDFETTTYVPVVCSIYQNQFSCEAHDCIWYFDEWLFQNHFIPYQGCVEKTEVAGECGSDFDTCQYCVSTTTCEAQNFCYWHNGNCWYGTGTCGEGLALQFCLDQSSCEAAGGNWYSDYCWLFPKTNLLNWSDYYDQYGDYATPSAFIDNLASSTGDFFQIIGGFLANFKNFFDIQNAYQKGKDFGSSISTARGYLKIFDSFFGSFPVSEMFVSILIFTLAVGVFRIVVSLRQLTKLL